MTIYSEFFPLKWVIFHSYASLPEGIYPNFRPSRSHPGPPRLGPWIPGFAKWMRMAFPQVEIDIHLGEILGFV